MPPASPRCGARLPVWQETQEGGWVTTGPEKVCTGLVGQEGRCVLAHPRPRQPMGGLGEQRHWVQSGGWLLLGSSPTLAVCALHTQDKSKASRSPWWPLWEWE